MLSDKEAEAEDIGLSGRLITLLSLGIVLFFTGVAVLLVASVFFGGSGSVGGVILIGPIPIIFGTGPETYWLIAVGILITVLSIVLFLIMNRRAKKFG